MTQLAHDPEKCAAVFGQDHAQTKELERDDDWKKRHLAIGARRADCELSFHRRDDRVAPFFQPCDHGLSEMAAFLHWPIGVRPGAPAVRMREVDIRALNRCGNRVHRCLMRHIFYSRAPVFQQQLCRLSRPIISNDARSRPFAGHALLSLAPSTASLTGGPRARPLRRLGRLDPRHATVDHHSVAFAAAFFALASLPDPGGAAMLAGRRKLIGHVAPFGVRPVSSRRPGGSRTEASLRTSQAGDELVVSAP